MTNAKNKNNSVKYHTPRTTINSSTISRSKIHDRKIFTIAKNSILTVIILSTMIIILVLLFMTFSDPERIIKSNIESYATDYYENHLYQEIATTSSSDSIAEIMQKYATIGFSPVPMRQLLVYSNNDQNEITSIISSYCDIGDSYIKFFPNPPFGKHDYRIEYHYACTFK